MMCEKRAQKFHSASDWLNHISHTVRPIRSTTQFWVVTRHQYGISALVSQTSFGGWTSGSVPKCRLFSQAIELELFAVSSYLRVPSVKQMTCISTVVKPFTISHLLLPQIISRHLLRYSGLRRFEFRGRWSGYASVIATFVSRIIEALYLKQ